MKFNFDLFLTSKTKSAFIFLEEIPDPISTPLTFPFSNKSFLTGDFVFKTAPCAFASSKNLLESQRDSVAHPSSQRPHEISSRRKSPLSAPGCGDHQPGSLLDSDRGRG